MQQLTLWGYDEIEENLSYEQKIDQATVFETISKSVQ